MSRTAFNPNPSRISVGQGYEPDGIRLRWLAIAVAGLIVSAVIIHAALWWLLKSEVRHVRSVDRPMSVVPAAATPTTGPALQPSIHHDRTPPEDLAAMRRSEDEVFRAMGWDVQPQGASPPDALIARAAANAARRKPTTSPATQPRSRAATVTPVPGADQGVSR